jgi:hypothetical protein
MKTLLESKIIFLIIFLMGIHVSETISGNAERKLIAKPADWWDYKVFDVNNISAYVTNYGSIFRNAYSGGPGFEWPKGSGLYAIFAAGPWIGAMVNGEPRVAVAQYSYEYLPGSIDPVTHQPADPNDPQWKIIEDDHPAKLGDRSLFMVFNEADTNGHVNMGSLPLGVEVQLTVFGWNSFTNNLANVIFLHYLIINRGINHLDSVFFAMWSDTDLGDGFDDLAGCDTTTSLGYCYNSTDNDGDYGEHPPAVGIQFLQGPIITSISDTAIFLGGKRSDYRNLPMTSFVTYAGGSYNEGDPQSTADAYNYMNAHWRNGQHMTYGQNGANPNNPQTTYMFSGDPETNTGWLDDVSTDRLLMVNSGPFDMVSGDSQEVVIAALIDRGTSNLNSATRLKAKAAFLKHFYKEYGYQLFRGSPYNPPQPPEPPIPERLGLFQNYPNPFNNRTTIKYQLPIPRIVHLEIFNAAGQRVATLVNEPQEPDEYEVVWDASGLASGIYFARLRVAQYVFTKKLLLLK